MSTVYITQEVLKLDDKSGAYTPQYNLTPALKYGEPVVLAPHGLTLISTEPLVRRIRSKLVNFNDDDYILALGDPAIIGIACSIASEINDGRYRLLKWDRETRQYIPVRIDLNGESGNV
jgi:hypothetical protein